ncbi:dermonecrotic toxin domain-containing protein [Pseudomonas serboccidentalis]|uniref:dermonecrotic toxin domain-containing protein n=1 Tax=Pseudomonas serboccidentalis TaxID=2964670 RepID=UPI0039DFD12D
MNTEAIDSDTFHVIKPDTHYQPLINAIPLWVRQAAPHRRSALRNSAALLPASLKGATANQHAEMKSLIARHAASQNRLDEALSRLQNPGDFAAPLLETAIQKRFGLTLDVRNTWLRLYIPDHLPWLRMKSGAARTWTVSLLEGALHNFEASETGPQAFEPASSYISAPGPNEQFSTLTHIADKMPITAFTQLCRELDIGRQYREYLEDNLGISNPVAAALLRSKAHESQSAALTTALHMAQMQKLLSVDSHRQILDLLDARAAPDLHGHDLTLLNARLTGILLFAPDLERTRDVQKVVVYLPDDPAHPIKEYASSAAFAEELTRRLREPDYQTFFSRFIDHADRGQFFAQLNNQLAPLTWHPTQRGDSRPSWREQPNPRPSLRINATVIQGNLQTHLYQRKLDKILNDARVLAVATATVDQQARWALWDSFTEIASTLLNIAAFIALPFVPFLGELMLAYTAYQLLDDTFEGVIDWAEGQGREAIGHFIGVVESAVQLGTFAVGGTLVVGELSARLPNASRRFFERFNPVKRPNGDTRYWLPDLKPYEQSIKPPAQTKPEASGLHQHQGKTLLPLDDTCYAVTQDSRNGQYRIEHPSRPEAYQPRLQHNDAGAWQTELDQPQTWNQATLLRRSGPDVQRVPATQRDRLLLISDCDENALRKAHVNQERLPPLFADTLKRFNIDEDIQTFIDQMNSDHPDDYLQADLLTQLELLQESRHWPRGRGLRLSDDVGTPLWQSNLRDLPALELVVTKLEGGDLLKTLLMMLPESETKALMGEPFDAPAPRLEARTRHLRQTLSQLARDKRQHLFDQRYRRLEQGADALTQKIMDADSLPRSIAQALLDGATDTERQQLKRGTLSPRLTEQAWEAGLQVRLTRAYEGLELQSNANNADTQMLALHTLEQLPGWSGRLRLEVRHYSPDGSLIDSVGAADAPTRKIMVLRAEGDHQAFDDTGDELSGGEPFYDCLLRAMPDSERAALNLRIGEGEKLRLSIRDHALARDALRSLLAQQPKYKPTYDPTVMRLLGGTDGYNHMPRNTPSLSERAGVLFPHLSPGQLESFVERLQRHPTGPRAELTRMMNQYTQLHSTLSAWGDAIPQRFPNTGIALTYEQIVVQRAIRLRFMHDLINLWRMQETIPDAEEYFVDFRFIQPIIGELPVLDTEFSCVRQLTLEGHPATRGVHDFLRSFTGMQRMALRNFNLGRLPDNLAQTSQIQELILSECAITLTPQSHVVLANLTRLTTLDLYKNPLELVPSVENMPALNYLDVSQTGISSFPDGLLTRPLLRTALLNGNTIAQLPAEVFELPSVIQDGIDLGNNPLDTTDLERIKQHFLHTLGDFGVSAADTDIQRVQTLYPLMDREEASHFIYLLPGDLAEGREALTRLEAELATLESELAAWTADVPALHPRSQQPFTAQQLQIEHLSRDEFRQQLLRCWRREVESDDFSDLMHPGFQLTLDTQVTGNLPRVKADFKHVSLMFLESSHGLTGGVPGFLESFPNLKALTLHQFDLDHLPSAIFTMGKLRSLNLAECTISLSQDTALELAQMSQLEFIDLSNNPLILAPDVSQMPQLTTLLLDSTGISELPAGLRQLKHLEMVDLGNNAIVDVPHDILEWPQEFSENIDLQGNPFSRASLQLLISYFRLTSVDFGIDAVIENAELEVSSSGDSAVDE